MRTRLLVCMAALALAGCDATSPTDELSAARHRWEAWGPASYDLVVQRLGCECLSTVTTKVVVAVRSGTVSRYRYEDNQPVFESFLQYPDVPGFFDLIATQLAEGHTVEVKYDAVTGVPLRIDIDPQDIPVDGGYSLLIELRSGT